MEYQNAQLYLECQLISIWNAARFYNKEELVPKMGTPEYEQACEDFHCKNGSCLGVIKELNRLGLKMIGGKWDLKWISKNLPVELSIFKTKEGGAHSILVVNVIGNRMQVTNYVDERTVWVNYITLFDKQIHNQFFLPNAIRRKKINIFVTFLKNLRIIKYYERKH